MPRRRRHFSPGAMYHVIMRGNNRLPLFHDDDERIRFFRLLEEGVERYGHQIGAFCLMTNHVHLLIRVQEIPLSEICHNLTFRYCRFHNRKHHASGHLFQGRFQSLLVDSYEYLRTLIRYIHLNPVKAGLVDLPQHYQWSSHKAYLGQESIPWLTCFDALLPSERNAFHQFVLAGIGQEDPLDFHVDQTTADLQALVSLIENHYNSQLKPSTLRALTALIARKVRGISLSKVAHYFGQQPDTLSKAASRFQAKIRASPKLQTEIDELWKVLFFA